MPRRGLLRPRSSQRVTPTLPAAGAVPAGGTVAPARRMVTAGAVQAVAGFPALQPVKSIRTGCGKQRRSPHRMPTESWKPPSERRCLWVGSFADAVPPQCDSQLLQLSPAGQQRWMPVHCGHRGQGTKPWCIRRGTARGFCPPSRLCGSQSPAPGTPWRGCSETPCATRVHPRLPEAAVHLLLVYILLVSFSFFPRPFAFRIKTRHLAACGHAVFPTTLPTDSLCRIGIAKSAKECRPCQHGAPARGRRRHWNSPCSQKVPRQPGLQVQAPLTWSQAAPFSH